MMPLQPESKASRIRMYDQSFWLAALAFSALRTSAFHHTPYVATPKSAFGRRSSVSSLVCPAFVTMRRVRRRQDDKISRALQVNDPGQPPYGIAEQDLSSMWLDLVREGKVSVTVPLGSNNEASTSDEMIMVNYGVRMVETRTENGMMVNCEEFVFQAGVADEVSQHPVIREINSTLAKKNRQQDEAEFSISSPTAHSKSAGDFVAQLQLVRTLRPPPSPGFSGTTTSIPPPYDPETDSFVTGSLRLELRPLLCRLELPKQQLRTSWDVFHNVSPADTRGHFLLVPTLADKDKNWRAQVLTEADCNDLVSLASTIEPPGSLILGYNSVGAGASQNHIHCHAWPSPPIPLLRRKERLMEDLDDDTGRDQDASDGWNAYPVSNVGSIYDFFDIEKEPEIGRVEASYLKYPVYCVQLSASTAHLKLLAKAVAVCMEAIGVAPHNICFMNRRYQPHYDDDHDEDDGDGDVHSSDENDISEHNRDTTFSTEERFVDVYVFARSKERSDNLPSLKLGVSEMMGVFHAQSADELSILSSFSTPTDVDVDGEDASVMELCLKDVSYDEEERLWGEMKDRLSSL